MEYYKKVYIKSEVDLPKETGEMILHENFDGAIRYSIFKKEFKQEWIEIVKWYLSPIRQPGRDEIIEVLKSFKEDFESWAMHYANDVRNEERCSYNDQFMSILNCIASELSGEEVVAPSDEDIEKWAWEGLTEDQMFKLSSPRTGVIFGAQAMRDGKIKPTKS